MDVRQFVKRFLAYGVAGYVAIHLVIWVALLIGALAAYRPDVFSRYGVAIVVTTILLAAGLVAILVLRRRRTGQADEPDGDS